MAWAVAGNIRGPQGPQGDPGPKGDDGAGIQIAGSVATYGDLPERGERQYHPTTRPQRHSAQDGYRRVAGLIWGPNKCS